MVTDPPYGVGIADWDSDIPPQAILTECLRVSRGPVVWFGAASAGPLLSFAGYNPQPERCLVWAPSFSLAKTSKSRIFYRWHPIWCWRMPKSQASINSDVLRDNCEGKHWWDHPATKPAALMCKLVKAVTVEDGEVLDPFAGSGTTGVACVQTGRNFIGFEIDPGYCEIARRRIAEAVPLFAGSKS